MRRRPHLGPGGPQRKSEQKGSCGGFNALRTRPRPRRATRAALPVYLGAIETKEILMPIILWLLGVPLSLVLILMLFGVL